MEKVMGYAESSKTERLANLMNGRVMWMKLQWPSFAWHPCIPPGLSTPRSWPKGERKRQHPSPPANCIAWVLRQGQVIDCTNGRTENINSWHRLRIHMITRQSPPPDVTNERRDSLMRLQLFSTEVLFYCFRQLITSNIITRWI